VLFQTLKNDNLPDPLIRRVGYTYDSNGNLETVTPDTARPDVVHTFRYTPVDGVKRYLPPDAGVAVGTETGYGYNDDRQLRQITRPDGQTVDYLRDSAGRVEYMNYNQPCP
jgi:YD repeat-containing protein